MSLLTKKVAYRVASMPVGPFAVRCLMRLNDAPPRKHREAFSYAFGIDSKGVGNILLSQMITT